MKDTINKYRQARKGNTEFVVVEGAHAIKHAVRFGAEFAHIAVSSTSDALSILQKFGTNKELSYVKENATTLDVKTYSELSPNPPDTGIIGLAKKPKTAKGLVGDIAVFIENPNSLFNVGAIIRTLAAFNVSSFIMTGRHNPWHADCINTSRGLHFALRHISLISDVKELEIVADKYKIYALDTNTNTPIKEIGKSADKKIFMFGTERDGLSKEALQMAENVVKIPMREGVSSLNLASSVAIAIYAIRQKPE